MHPAHKIVAEITEHVANKIKIKMPFYAYYVFPPIGPGHRNQPKLYVDISDVFALKKTVMNIFKTQKMFFSFYQIPATLFNNWLAGFKADWRIGFVDT